MSLTLLHLLQRQGSHRFGDSWLIASFLTVSSIHILVPKLLSIPLRPHAIVEVVLWELLFDVSRSLGFNREKCNAAEGEP